MKLTLQLLTYNSTSFLPFLFDSLVQQTDRNWDLLIYDCGSQQEELEKINEIVDDYRQELKIEFTAGENKGFAGGHQYLWKQNDADLVLLVNHDVILTPDYIAKIKRYLEDHEQVASAAGKILRWEFGVQGEPELINIVDSLGLAKTFYQKVYDIGTGKKLSEIDHIETDVFGISGCLPMYRRVAIGNNLFDPNYFMYKEDVDIAYRLYKAGWTATLVPEAVAYHFRGLPKTFLHIGIASWAQFQSFINHERNLRKHLNKKDWIRYGWAVIPYEIMKASFLFITHPIQFPQYVLRHCGHHGNAQ